ncbi:proton-conducting transporter membrane subunit [Propionicimonas sp.]|uniref:proton-conducting transporter transmembrane domain-containing protein n=1 Tax=Propionicimonas sp. TaxID=1955623 RepID=UPI0017F7519D|nr:proton-conducting transporter membrane subunit [Propionicimonas sp.]MBU3976883.1 hydrogenase 4 subunit B [Actinomycetota bacterium]MBA3019572.1 hydrogenase 4 subunit B [Propionicimonas sp.]MBU3986978.1 hydrogenase 4 subunit B [Actinomycetota bacterium]MBU4006890.1 hydrogenase 4 subunit B [Actinomycetota bacterium]MBU4065590.1 hydrogenase 4 subunit B [Actinomycetota bacterium]
MNLVDAGLYGLLGSATVAIVMAIVLTGRVRNVIAGLAVLATGVAAALTGLATLLGYSGTGLAIPVALPLVGDLDALVLAPDRLGGFFMLLAGLVIAASALFGIGYAHGPAASRTGWTGFAAFALGVVLVPAAADAITFLLAWELMALGSTVLLLAEHATRQAVRAATIWYAVMTHLSFLLLLAGFGVLINAAGGTSWARMVGIAEPTASLAFALLVAGFATKAGLVPVHVWLPRAHPEAPSHASAAMSAAMVKMGIYGILLVTLRLLPNGPSWWAVVLVALGAISALYGILQASVQSDLKRLLAYSTTENVGLITTAIGVGLLLHQSGQHAAADVALIAALLLALSHAAFKTVLFLGAGAVLHATGERDLDQLGGLASRMPITALTFGVGALGAAALPVTSGFVAEWVLLQALIHADAKTDRLLAVVMPLTMGVVALTIGLGLLTFVKAAGIGFLARPRSQAASEASEVGFSMRLALLGSAGLTIGLGLIPGPLSQLLAGAVGASGIATTGLTGLELGGLGVVVLNPLALTALTLVLLAGVLVVNGIASRRHPRREVELPWGCGGERTSPRMEYNATSYSEPLARVFGGSLHTRRSVEVEHPDDAPLLVSGIEFNQETVDLVEHRVYLPAARLAERFGDFARKLQNGSIHRYVGFSFAALLLVLVLVTR